jgi:hypothetical protein
VALADFRRQSRRLGLAAAQQWIGREILSGLEALRVIALPQEARAPIERLESLAEDLSMTGQLLATTTPRPQGPGTGRHDAPTLLQTAWQEVQRLVARPCELTIEGREAVEGERSELLLVFERILQWFALRARSAQTPEVRVHCVQSATASRLVFEGRGPRLPAPLRRHLFKAFSLAVPDAPMGGSAGRPGRHLPLYLAKILVEVRNGGQLWDDTDNLPGDLGHRLILELPRRDQ